MIGFFQSACAQHAADTPAPAPSKGLELSVEPYSTARGRFQTKLTRHGPAPGSAELLEIPSGAHAEAYESKGLRLQAIVSSDPRDGQSHPAVVFLHGGFGFGKSQWEMPRAFREAGFVVAMPVLRGENGQAGDFSLFFNEVDDVLAAADQLASLSYVDRNRLFVAGHSVGGTLAMLAAMASPRFRAAASISGSPDQIVYTQGRAALIPFDPKNLDEFRIRSPVVFATSFQCPARLYFGDEELWLQASTERTARVAASAGLDVRAIELAGDHSTTVSAAIEQTIRFFRSR